ncbi:MAG: hypothetical protein E7308_05070 [Butyrivibrio sp.]|nr:hypothetical protein [Butyrivibrio sp.]
MDVDMKIFVGLLVTGIIFIILGAACISFSIFGRRHSESQRAHGPFGVFLIFVGMVLTMADTLTANAFMAAVFGLLLAIVLFHYGINSIRKKKQAENKAKAAKSNRSIA